MFRILIIDDNESVRESITFVLESKCYDVVGANSGKGGSELYSKQNFDLVITDIFMPEKDGLEVIQEIHRHYSYLKILVITAHPFWSGLKIEPMARMLGADRVLIKPFDSTDLLDTVQSLLGTSD